ncbi:MAG: divalent-cation tolerance protein CutA [Chloroflexota bacterium]|nr:divalent-cation tolerance protein CutA [Chloroflexota bacterium]MDQ5864187.1 divalent-cation tolerance protein CutA [Chloroflexota bacterium]
MEELSQRDNPLVILYVPCSSEAEATGIASRLLSERLIACANIYASRSLYVWNGEMAEEQEMVLVCKTVASRAEDAAALVEQIHSYDVPCVLRIVPAEANSEYYRWVSAEVTSPVKPSAGQTTSGAN